MKRSRPVDIPVIKLEPQRLMQIDERRFARAIVRYAASVGTGEPIRPALSFPLTHLRAANHAQHARHGHDVPGAPREHGGEEGLEGPEVGEGVGTECAAAGESPRSAFWFEVPRQAFKGVSPRQVVMVVRYRSKLVVTAGGKVGPWEARRKERGSEGRTWRMQDMQDTANVGYCT